MVNSDSQFKGQFRVERPLQQELKAAVTRSVKAENSCLRFISVVVIKHQFKQQLCGGEEFLLLAVPGHSPLPWGSQGRNLKSLVASLVKS